MENVKKINSEMNFGNIEFKMSAEYPVQNVQVN